MARRRGRARNERLASDPAGALEGATHAGSALGAPFGLLNPPLRVAKRFAQSQRFVFRGRDFGARSFLVRPRLAEASRVNGLLVERHPLLLPPPGTAAGALRGAD